MKNDIASINRVRYAEAPTWEMIRKKMKKHKIKKLSRLAALFGINANVLYMVKSGDRQLPIHFWHIFYEDLDPILPELPFQRKITQTSTQQPSYPVAENEVITHITDDSATSSPIPVVESPATDQKTGESAGEGTKKEGPNALLGKLNGLF